MSNKTTFIPDNGDKRTPPEIVEEPRKVSENLLPPKLKEKFLNEAPDDKFLATKLSNKKYKHK